MSKIKLVKAHELLPFTIFLLKKNRKVILEVTGSSMFPFLLGSSDYIKISGINYDKLKILDVVLIQRCNGQYVLHRLIRKEKYCFFINGDSQMEIEGPFKPNQIVAKVSSVYRGKRVILCNGFWWIFFSKIWFFLLPIRQILCPILDFGFKIYIYMNSLFK